MSLGFKKQLLLQWQQESSLLPLWHYNQLHYREVCAFYGREVGHQHPLPQCTTATGYIIAPVEGLIITVKHLNSLYTLKNCNTTKTAPYLYSPLHYDSLHKHALLNYIHRLTPTHWVLIFIKKNYSCQLHILQYLTIPITTKLLSSNKWKFSWHILIEKVFT